jgi:potassium efflux system protein
MRCARAIWRRGRIRALAAGCLLMCWAWFALLNPALGQTETTALYPVTPSVLPGSQSEVSAEQVESAKKIISADALLDEELKKKILEFYDQATKWLQETDAVKASGAQLDQLIQEAPGRIGEIDRRLKAVGDGGGTLDEAIQDASLSIEQLDFRISEQELALSRLRDSLHGREEDLSRLLVGSKELNEDIAIRQKHLDQISHDLAAAPADEPPQWLEAKNLTLKVRRALRQAELELFRKRLANQTLLTNLMQAEKDLLAVRIAHAQETLEKLRERAQTMREDAAKAARKEADQIKQLASVLPPEIQAIAETNASFRSELEALVRTEKAVSEQMETARRELGEIKTDFEWARQRVDVVGPSEAIGRMLRRRREALPSLSQFYRKSRERGAEISRATDRQLDIDEIQRNAFDTDKVLNALEVRIGYPLGEQREELKRAAQGLATVKRETQHELRKVYGRYVSELAELDVAERQLIEAAEAFAEFIDDQLLWIPNRGLKPLLDTGSPIDDVMWLLRPTNWWVVAWDMLMLVTQKTALVLAFMLVWLGVFASRRRYAQRMAEISQQTSRIRTDSFQLTLRALWLTAATGLALPSVILFFGWSLQSQLIEAPFTTDIARGAFNAGLLLASLGVLQRICRKHGLGDRHLRWSEVVREQTLRHLRWFIPFSMPLAFLVAATHGSDPAPEIERLGRVAFIVLMAGVAVLAARLLRRHGALAEPLLHGNAEGWFRQLHFLWFPLAVGTPLALAVTSALGYHYTAMHLEQRVQMTLWFLLGMLIVKDLLLRWFYIAERRLRYEDAIRRRDELRAQRSREDDGFESDSAHLLAEAPEVDFDQLSGQTVRLIHGGLLLVAVIGMTHIWSDILPAVGFFNSTELPFLAMRNIDGVMMEVPVTLANLLVGLFIMLITVLAARNVPGVLEITLLQRLPFDPGARYAITTLSQYAMIIVGVVAAFSSIGLQWSNVQWLVAALSVGLGFGLQEIVANFISGIILLFERPIRVGDVVTVDGTTGVVSRIRIRATTITNYDRQEFLVPNKEFITGRLINWTLSDTVNRVLISVGVAYGSDVQQAMALLIQAAGENENVLDDPKPVASFEAFGDNALTLVLRSYLGSLDNRIATITALHQAIYDKFHAAGIEISFPQRDLHLSASHPLEVRWHPAGSVQEDRER